MHESVLHCRYYVYCNELWARVPGKPSQLCDCLDPREMQDKRVYLANRLWPPDPESCQLGDENTSRFPAHISSPSHEAKSKWRFRFSHHPPGLPHMIDFTGSWWVWATESNYLNGGQLLHCTVGINIDNLISFQHYFSLLYLKSEVTG